MALGYSLPIRGCTDMCLLTFFFDRVKFSRCCFLVFLDLVVRDP
ncbi:uncharacterized protein G2W53_039863 [Senna tora]|uniref:Uncharacterized protein n=1 Tax=Senna tora TaxID=362788 RepID=A0A834SQ74_9FABA|nr:uncharacterized protein G2W53_039863 [Senna tora]